MATTFFASEEGKEAPERKNPFPPGSVCCAVYARTEPDEDASSLCAQREAAEAFIAARKDEAWLCLPDRYDDQNAPGDSLDRPALQRLITDLDEAVIDAVVVDQAFRLAATLPAFTQLMNLFQAHDVAFACVRPPLNTRDSVSRLMLHVLMSLNQFEHELGGYQP